MPRAEEPFVFAKPYTLRSTGRWPFRNHQIMFEDTPVVFSCNDHELASHVVAALNGAYNLGRSHELALHAAQKAAEKPEACPNR